MDLQRERQLVEMLVNRLSQVEVDEWADCGSSHRFMAYAGKELILYNLLFDKPNIQDRLTCLKFSADADAGLSSLWRSESHGQVRIGHTPTRVFPMVFLWHVFGSGIEYVPHNGRFGLRVPLALRTRANPNLAIEGATYVLERSLFNEKFSIGE